ncbi:MAG: hypothetical protein ACE5JL_17920 [Dehalococcoidia bacterium]
MCRYGQGVVRAIFEEFDAQNLKGFTVWLPIMGGDNAEAARVESEAFGDRRMGLAWDPESRAGELFTKALKLRRTVWDAYLLYAPGVRWEGDETPQPTFWMHQLSVADYGVDGKLLLNPGRLGQEVRRLLGKGAQPSDPDLPLKLHAKGLLWLRKERPEYSLADIYSPEDIKNAGETR